MFIEKCRSGLAPALQSQRIDRDFVQFSGSYDNHKRAKILIANWSPLSVVQF
jgi:hypothetical protein